MLETKNFGKLSIKKFRLGDLFDISGTKSLDEGKLDFESQGINFVGRVGENNGIKGKISKQDFAPNEEMTITATVIGNYKYAKFQKEKYYTSQNINKLKARFDFDKNIYYFLAQIQKFISKYNGQQGGYKLDELINTEIYLPTKNGEIDFEFMETFIRALEKVVIKDLVIWNERKLQVYREVVEK